MPINRWNHTLALGDVFRNEDMPFEARRDEIVRRIKAARWYDEDDSTLWHVVDELADTTDPDDFDEPWDEFYDWCDANRVWIDTRPRLIFPSKGTQR